MSILCRHRNRILVARRGKNELRNGFTMSVMCSRCQKDLGTEGHEGLPVLITYDEFMRGILDRKEYTHVHRWTSWSNYL